MGVYSRFLYRNICNRNKFNIILYTMNLRIKDNETLEAEQIGDALYKKGAEKSLMMLQVIHNRLIKRHQVALNNLRKFNK